MSNESTNSLGTSQGTADASDFNKPATINFYSAFGTSSTPTVTNEFYNLVVNTPSTAQGTASGVDYGGLKVASNPSYQLVEG